MTNAAPDETAAAPQDAGDERLIGFGGWLAFFVLMLALAPIGAVAAAWQLAESASSPWPLWLGLLLVALPAGMSLYTAFAIAGRWRTARRTAFIFLLGLALFGILEIVFAGSGRSLSLSLLWAAYFYRSKRVRATLVENPLDSTSPAVASVVAIGVVVVIATVGAVRFYTLERALVDYYALTPREVALGARSVLPHFDDVLVQAALERVKRTNPGGTLARLPGTTFRDFGPTVRATFSYSGTVAFDRRVTGIAGSVHQYVHDGGIALLEGTCMTGPARCSLDECIAAVEPLLQSEPRSVTLGAMPPSLRCKRVESTPSAILMCNCNATGTPSIVLHALDRDEAFAFYNDFLDRRQRARIASRITQSR